MTATPSPATRDGVVDTEDGWHITFDRIVLALGRASVDGDHCSIYAEASYTRVLSLIGAPDAQKISDSYAIGQCDFGFGITNADTDSLLGVGATQADFDLLRSAGTDKYAGTSGISLFVKGSATKAGVRKTFAWPFRARARYEQCSNTVDGVEEQGLTLVQSGDVDVDIGLHAEALFRSTLVVGQDPLNFDAIAAADSVAGDNDGEVTLDELGLVPLAVPQAPSEASPDSPAWTTLEDFVYLGAAPSIARFRQTGQCMLRSGPRRRD